MPGPSSKEKILEWEKRVHDQKESGLTIAKWCQLNQIRPHVFDYWKKKLSSYPKLDRSI
ncbi:MAG: hypothetical protein K9M07_05970 [Simkaniaceae bacterium]|nr:hypothetical protein [Simkaniaceae bacterium]